MALLLRPKYLLVYKIRRGELKRIGEGEKRRREKKEKEEEEEEEGKRRRRRREEKKEEGRGVQRRLKGMESNI